MTSKEPPGNPGGTSMIPASGKMSFDNTKKLSNQSQGEKILLMKQTGKENGSMEGVSPFVITRAVEGIAQGNVNKISWLRDGTVLIKTKNLKQAKNLVRLTGLPTGATVEILEHPRLNFSKGVIRTNLLRSVNDEDFLAEMKEQNIAAIQRIKKKLNNKEVETGTYFLTFSTCEMPKSIRMCYELLEVREFTPNPMRCWNCLSFNHTKKICTGKKICSNCGLD
jgi:hypothetical protein